MLLGDFCPIMSMLTCQSWMHKWSVGLWSKGRPSMGPAPPPPHRRLHQTNKTAAPLRYISDQVHGGAGSISALLVISPQWQLRIRSASSALGTGKCPRECREFWTVKGGELWRPPRLFWQRGLLLLASLASRCNRQANTCSPGRTS